MKRRSAGARKRGDSPWAARMQVHQADIQQWQPRKPDAMN
jgi:tRNA1(Val) A37 N6-methylase TrmN6